MTMHTRLPLFLFTLLAGISIAPGAGVVSRQTSVPFANVDGRKGLAQLERKVKHSVEVQWDHSLLVPVFLRGRLTGPGYASSADMPSAGIRFLAENTELFGLQNPARELRAVTSFTDDLGMTHVKYQQEFEGVTVFHGQLIVHFSRDGSVESFNGRYFPTPRASSAPTLGRAEAVRLARAALGGYVPDSETASLAFYAKGVHFLLTYAVRLPSFRTPMMTVFVDAHRGDIVKIDDGIRYDGPVVGSGKGLDGNMKTLHTYQYGGNYFMIDASLPMYVAPIDSLKGVVDTYDALNDTSGNGYKSLSRFADPDGDNVFDDNSRMPAGVDAHIFSRNVYEIYRQRYNRNSLDNKGLTLMNVAHYGIKLNNAYWNGFFMTYGDGDGVRYSNLCGSLDVIAHEMTHGVTSNTADLVYELQPGAVNESISDVFACVVDSLDWLIGEDVFTPAIAGDGLRSMQDPHNGFQPGEGDWQPATMSEFVVLANDEQHDFGGVHINSGIPNKAFYNVASVTGRSKAGLIWYRALTTYLTKNSQFADLRTACLNSAKDLYGDGSAEYVAVGNGFSAVGIETETGTTHNLVYDDGNAGTGVYESAASWELAVRFTPPVPDSEVMQVAILAVNENNPNGNGHFTLKLYKADGTGGVPKTQLISPYSYTPQQAGWQTFDLSNVRPNGDFYVSMLYDGTNQPLLGADVPPGNGRAYEYDPATGWYRLTSPYDYTLFMRSTVRTLSGIVTMDTRVPRTFAVDQNYPNPFNPSTTIRYALPSAGDVHVGVYDIHGKNVATLVENHQAAGTYEVTWNGRNDAGHFVASGVYFYRVRAGTFVAVHRMMLLK